ncbi:hypothetical protein BB561_002846 [Smittium simulii]|uniref:Prefoldin subunit 4 n=1 Tax=Smittium simulii TaxID=133385 RepID=A0A2T9YP30_9FUNG|nr:hypothetical protein BB561_002846 [Smittium simulii]
MDKIRLLERTNEKDTELGWEDQLHINQFSKLNSKYEVLEQAYETAKKEKEYLVDLEMELELLDEESKIAYKLGDAFVKLGHEEALEQVETDKKAAESKLDGMKTELDSISQTLSELKTKLYAKFGNSINLDKD